MQNFQIEALAAHGYVTDMPATPTKYVLCLVVDPVRMQCIGLTKGAGPAELIGKISFPGGKLDLADRSVEAAATRELLEETGVFVPESAWELLCANAAVTVAFAFSTDVHLAMTLEDEPVHVLAIQRQLSYCVKNPEAYVPDFGALLGLALSKVTDARNN